MFSDSVMWGILGGIISIADNGWFFAIYYAMLLCAYNFWIDNNAIYAPSSSGILKYFCLGIFVIFVMMECFMWFRLTDSYYTRGMSPDTFEYNTLFDDKERLIYDSMHPYAVFHTLVITCIFSFFISFVVAFFIIKLSFFIHKKLRKNSDEKLCDFHKGKAIAFGLFAFITMLPLMYLPLRDIGRYLFSVLLF